MIIVRKKDASTFPAPLPSRKVTKIMMDPVLGSKHVALGLTVYPVGEKGAPHSHTGEETIVILEGKAKVSNTKKQQIIEPGDVVYLPPDETHIMENAGEEELHFLWIYTPPGDEKSIRQRARNK
jgi:quercetin dioxygenase-like cupin family protein